MRPKLFIWQEQLVCDNTSEVDFKSLAIFG